MDYKQVKAYIGLGSNIGDREEKLKNAIFLLKETDWVEVAAVSSFYNTAPEGYVEQPDFLNAVVQINTTLTANELLEACGSIEEKMKRERVIRWGPRTIDLDILFYGDEIIMDKHLIVPHPRMQERIFVLEPLNEIAPQTIHPESGKTVHEMYQALLNN